MPDLDKYVCTKLHPSEQEWEAVRGMTVVVVKAGVAGVATTKMVVVVMAGVAVAEMAGVAVAEMAEVVVAVTIGMVVEVMAEAVEEVMPGAVVATAEVNQYEVPTMNRALGEATGDKVGQVGNSTDLLIARDR